MKTNNYTKAENGPSIEAHCYLDTDLSRMNFEDAFEMLQYSGYRTSSIAYYIDGGNVKGADSISFIVKGTVPEILKYARDNFSYYAEIIAADGKDLQDIKDEIINSLTPGILTYEELNENDLKDTGLEFAPDKTLVKVSIHGYSQGDYATVFYCPDDLQAAWGNAPVESDLKKTFTHLFYDAPIYATFNIDGIEYSYHETPFYDEYDWKRDEFLAYVSKESGVPVETLESFLPEYPTVS